MPRFVLGAMLLLGVLTAACEGEPQPPEDVAPELPDWGPVTCGSDGFGAAEQRAQQQGESLYYGAQSAADAPYDILLVELYARFGDPPPLTGPGQFELGESAAELDYASCGTCVLMYRDCTDDGACASIYFAVGGKLTITSWDDHFAGRLEDVELMRVQLDPQLHVSPLAELPGHCIEHYDFDVEIDPPCTNDEACAPDHCDLGLGACVECLEDAHCSDSVWGPVCDKESQLCVKP